MLTAARLTAARRLPRNQPTAARLTAARRLPRNQPTAARLTAARRLPRNQPTAARLTAARAAVSKAVAESAGRWIFVHFSIWQLRNWPIDGSPAPAPAPAPATSAESADSS